ncbi:MAG: hypothetical protein DWQ36_05050 [Acidobacteria bacterium]|nr:MAG: hypothetical protein DWQ30_10470 [Acidobacteriota bacterium]REK10152.1 MAG: hypothetical protein DWQ36_05050 [Acidobacteriota bacterium]
MALALLVAAAATAQEAGSGEPGALPEPAGNRTAEVQEAMEEARWTFGNTKLSPYLGLVDSGWVRNAFDAVDADEVDDFTATLRAGLSLFHRIGTESVLALWGLPEYVWWADLEDRRRLNGRYGAGWYADFTRLGIEIEATRADEQRRITPEVRELTSQRADRALAGARIGLYRSLDLQLRASSSDFDALVDPGPLGARAQFGRLDRREEVFQIGLAMRLRDAVDVAVGAFQVSTEFEQSAASPDSVRLDNDGDGLYLELAQERTRVEWRTRLEHRELDPEGPAATARFPGFDDLLGLSAITLHSLDRRRSLGFYGRRELFYALGPEFAYFISERFGATSHLDLGRSTTVQLTAEVGDLSFQPIVGTTLQRGDDLTSFGVTVLQELPYGVGLSLGVLHGTIDSSSASLADDRSITSLTFGLDLRSISWP